MKRGARAKGGVGLMLHKKYTSAISKFENVSERILVPHINLQISVKHITSEYAPEDNRQMKMISFMKSCKMLSEE